MKKLTPILVIAVLLVACGKEEVGPSREARILGNWQVVSDSYEPIVTEWGLFYIGSVKFYPDNTFKLNLFTSADDPSRDRNGTWKWGPGKQSITFFSAYNDGGKVYKATNKFSVSFDSSGKLILQNGDLRIQHKKLDN